MSRAAAVLGVLLALVYPLVVYVGLTRGSTRVAAAIMLGGVALTLVPRLRGFTAARAASVLAAPLVVCALVGAAAATDDARFLLALPVLVSAVLLIGFGASLRPASTPMIERFARLIDPDLPPARAAHCRQVTWAWCGFFVVNGAVALALGALAPLAWWALWTGLLSYVAMGLLFMVELVVRRRRFPDAPGLLATVRGLQGSAP